MMSDYRPFVFVLVLFFALEAQAAAPVAQFEAPRTSCVAPCAIFFDARATTDADIPQKWRQYVDLTYVWDFGDPGSGNWSHGASNHSRNIDTGYVAGHLYENPGTYLVRLTVSDGTQSSVATTTVSISDPDTHWSGTDTICISNDTNHTGCPAGARQVSNVTDFDAALNNPDMCNIASDSVRCLFKRGDTFAVDSNTNVRNPGPSVIGAYGSGAKPIIRVSTAITLLTPRSTNADLRVMDLSVAGTDVDTEFLEHAGSPVRQLLMLRVEVRDCETFADLMAGSAYIAGESMHDQIAIVDSISHSNAGGGFDLFMGAERLLFMGNDFGDKGGPQHVVRFNYIHGGVISHNSLGRSCGDSQHVVKIHNTHHEDLGVWGGNCSREFVFADNLVDGCEANDLDAEIGPNSSRGEECVEHFLVERNHFRQDLNGKPYHRSLVVSGHGVAVRNNVFDLSGEAHVGGPIGLTVRDKVPTQTSHPVDNRIYNNTCFTSDNPTKGVCIMMTSAVDRAIVKNNMLWASHPSASVALVEDEGTNATYCSSGAGIGDCNRTFTENPFVSSSPRNAEDYKLHSGATLAIEQGDTVPATPMNLMETTVPVDGDDQGGARMDLGAFEYTAGGAAPPPTASLAPPFLLE
jgi:PKD repeat protein